MNKSKVLLIEDDPEISASITDFLTRQGYDVIALSDAPEALDYLRGETIPHIALIDLTLPTMHGFELANKIKAQTDMPIIFVATVPAMSDLVQGMKKYAEDFIVKPFDMPELMTRIEIVLARMPSFDYAKDRVMTVDAYLRVNFAHHNVILNGTSISLTPTETILLNLLIRNAGRVVENRTLIARVWPTETVHEDTLRVHMHRLRRKLEGDSHHPHYIRTKRGVGYLFTVRPPEGTHR